MRIKPEALPGALRDELPGLVWISGDEPLLVGECRDAVRAAAREAGCEERIALHVQQHFEWASLVEACSARSLFASRSLVELHMPTAKPGAEGGRILRELADSAGQGNLLMILTGHVPGSAMKTAWIRALQEHGWHVPVYEPERRQLPGWVEARLARHGLKAGPDVLRALAESAEGNLLSASQEIEKLALVAGGEKEITLQLLREALSDGSRYDAFDTVDAALDGDPARVLRTLARLREEGVELPPVLGALTREIRTLAALCAPPGPGRRSEADIFGRQRIWESRKQLLRKAARRHSSQSTTQMVRLAARIDMAIRGREEGDPWIGLETLALRIAGCRPVA